MAKKKTTKKSGKRKPPVRYLVLVLVIGLALAGPAAAQSPTPVTASSGVRFDPSSDHGTLNADGTPKLSHYEWRYLPGGGCQPIAAVNVGKPAPVGGTILVQPLAGMGTLSENCTYTGVIVAVGPGGEGASTPSDPFVRSVPKAPAAPAKPAVVP